MTEIAQETYSIGDKKKYWESFYANRRDDSEAPLVPSQFAAFFINEVNSESAVIEFGCGNGRDSEFFSRFGLEVFAIDGSKEAIKNCQERYPKSQVKYCFGAAKDVELEIIKFASEIKNKHISIYARFFLHALTLEEQTDFLSLLSRILPQGALVFLEYRISQDKNHKKEFGAHYRRFIDHAELIDSIVDYHLVVDYEITGRRFAKYKSEDALVGRCILRKI